MRAILSLTLLFSLCFSAFCWEIKNIDKTLKGHWDFKMQKKWTLEEAGNEVFTVIDALKCTNEGTVYVMDRKHFKVFIISKKGEYLSSFGKRGDGPGEVTTLRSLYLLDSFVIVVDDRNIHYFSSKAFVRLSPFLIKKEMMEGTLLNVKAFPCLAPFPCFS